MRHLASLMLACCLLIAAGTAQAGEGETKRAREALRVLDEIMQAPDRRLPGNLLKEAYAVAVIPDVLKAGFVTNRPRARWNRRTASVVATARA